ncbi:hypothetical protein DIPPA_05141 [Diplonema papillatum]|nr:hypothetical protein DIPPA_05141 [Diplonema papillatum]
MSEDALVVNVFAPSTKPSSATKHGTACVQPNLLPDQRLPDSEGTLGDDGVPTNMSEDALVANMCSLRAPNRLQRRSTHRINTTAATSRERTEGPAAQHQSIPQAGGEMAVERSPGMTKAGESRGQ